MLLFLATIEDKEDRTKMEQIFTLYSKKLFRVALAIVHDPDDAEDAVQIAMVNACKHVKKLREPKDYDTMWYMMQATKNAAINIYNKNKNRWKKETAHDDAMVGEDYIDSYREGSDLARLITELPPRDRDVLMLKYEQGYEYAEIARIMGITEDAARKAGSRAKKRLKESLGEEGDE
ncbi:MAG: sigma-70 family RNA polymerase sigma factor [Lachnospiraceae bacterium]|jgi:RNA polymerase sigma-70 factor (ECF subfamily)|nr:sigma-70 family RNA polymerase sigma factor [Lachnospiraceae bacterium]